MFVWVIQMFKGAREALVAGLLYKIGNPTLV